MLLDLFSKRNRKPSKSIFTYDVIPQEFRIQIIHIWNDAIGAFSLNYYDASPSNEVWNFIHKQLSKEYGLLELTANGNDPFKKCQIYIQETSTERVLDIVELSFKYIDLSIRRWNHYVCQNAGISQKPDDAIFELNQRFREHGLGYQYIGEQIVRVDSDFIYREAVEPALKALFEEEFQGASEEFLSAHEHFRKGRNKEAITDALKAFESVMKTICKRMKWEVADNATAKPLINTLLKNELIPMSLQTQFSSLRDTLESGLPTVRNKNSGHGQGDKAIDLPPHLVAYALHLAATNILFLIESYKLMKPK
ncbi:STM4504/CBY_0614 family protein [Paenibacillus qinlingensis]|uniref:Abortive infection protein-like C-terminal domain-containing protein n=1 Tax=Paenibacillus qinlingensis TaxID=1837343 RepID=A0ABU1P426_9BACL|nr:hypothetical protein [Paenibacillus qinlingensis]MDR6553967.1 hypothetical protein [Paenibacillus qinlingensis]